MTVNGAAVDLQNVQVPSSVSVGGSLPVSYSMHIGDEVTDGPLLDADYCVAQNLADGVRVQVDLEIDGTVQSSSTYCWPIPGDGRTESFDIIAPTDVGTHTARVVVTAKNAGTFMSERERTFEVVSDDDTPTGSCPDGFVRQDGDCVPADDGGDGGGGDDGDDSDGENFLCDQFGIGCEGEDGPLAELGQTAKWAVILIVVLVVLSVLGDVGVDLGGTS